MEAQEISSNDKRRGALLLAAALLVIGFLVTTSSLEDAFRKGDFSADRAVGYFLTLFILWRAFRGGHISLKLVKVIVGLFVALAGVLAVVIVTSLCLGKPLPVAPNLANTIPVIGNLGAVAFVVWALFLSRRVKSYVAHVQFENERKKFGLKVA